MYLAQGPDLIDYSESPQDLGGVPPVEAVAVTNDTGTDQVYELYINRWSGNATRVSW